jgi:hypothetical protein
MNDTNTTQQRKTDGHISLGDGIHRTTHKWGFEKDITSDSSISNHIRSREVDLSGKHEEVVISEATMDARVHEILDGETI